MWQVEEDKFKLFYVLLQVPQTIVKHLNRVAQTGYDKLKLQVAGDTEAGEHDTEDVEYASEVRGLLMMGIDKNGGRILGRRHEGA